MTLFCHLLSFFTALINRKSLFIFFILITLKNHALKNDVDQNFQTTLTLNIFFFNYINVVTSLQLTYIYLVINNIFTYLPLPPSPLCCPYFFSFLSDHNSSRIQNLYVLVSLSPSLLPSTKAHAILQEIFSLGSN